jgi:hypothetical protein
MQVIRKKKYVGGARGGERNKIVENDDVGHQPLFDDNYNYFVPPPPPVLQH